MSKPKKLGLYNKVKRGIYRRIPQHSAYRSGLIVKKYKEEFKKKYGDEPAYEGSKKKDAPLTRWFQEDWKSDTGQYGYTDKSSVYRPTIRVSDKTPKTFDELSEEDIKKAKKEKAQTGRVKKFGGLDFSKWGSREREMIRRLKGKGWKPVFQKSNRKGKKYSVITPSGKTIHFGASNMQQFKDTTGLGLYSHLNHNDTERRKRYLARAKGIKNKEGKLTWNDKESPNYYSVHFLW